MAEELNLPILSEISLLGDYSSSYEPTVINNAKSQEEFSLLAKNINGIITELASH